MYFTEKQNQYIQEANCRYNIKDGATRSGKSFLDLYMIPKRIKEVRGCDGLIMLLGNTRGTLQRNIIEPLQKIWTDRLISSIKSDNTATIFGEKVYCLGADKVSQVDRLRGSSIKYCYGDEVVTWNEEVFQMLKSRLDKPYSKFDGTCNPDSPTHWFYKFIQNEKGEIDLYRQSYCINDNPTLDAEVVANLKKEYAGSVYYDRYILGKWVKAKGIIFDTFNESKIIKEPIQMQGHKWVSVDYGIQNATCFLLMCENDHITYVLDEYYYSGRDTNKQKTDYEYANDMLKFIKGHYIENIVIDPSAASLIAELRSRGLPVRSANNAVLSGLQAVNSAFALDRLKISEKCENLIKEINGYVWDDKASDERPKKENDHACDALRYGVMYNSNSDTIMMF